MAELNAQGSTLLQPSADDAGQTYLAERAGAARQDANSDAWADQFIAGRQAPAAPAQEGGAAAPKPKAGMDAWLEAARGAAHSVVDVGRAVGSAAGAVARDVGLGVVETPGAVYRGATGAATQLLRTADEVANWLNANVADLRVPAPEWLPKWAENPLAAGADVSAEAQKLFPARRSETGKLVEFTAQWLTSASMLGKVAGAMGVSNNIAARVLTDFSAGAAGFDPKQPRLSNAIDKVAPNPVTDFLKADTEDPALLARLKAGLETAGIGLAAEGVIRGLRFLRASRAAKAAPEGAAEAAAAPGVSAPQAVAQSAPAGPAASPAAPAAAPAPAVQISDDIAAKASAFLRGEVSDAPIQVNLSRFEGPDAIRDAIGRLSQALPEQEVIPMERTLQAARDLGMTPQQLAEGVQGGIFDRRQIQAGWMLFRSATDEVKKLADVARSTGSPEDLSRFNAAFQTTYGILRTVKGQSAEIARALQIHNALRRSEPGMVRELQQLLEAGGGAPASLEMAERIAMIGDPAKAAQFIAEAGQASTRDQIVYIWSNILLSNPASHIANVADTTLATLGQVPETWFASKIGNNVAAGEATARLYGIVKGAQDGLSLAARTLRTGETTFSVGTRVENTAGIVASPADLSSAPWTAKAADYLKMIIPTRVMQAGDELTKAMNYRGEMHAIAWRQAVISEGLEGGAASQRAAQLVSEAPKWLSDMAEAAAIKGTFNEPLEGAAQSIAQTVDRMNVTGVPVGRIIIPFVRTPANLLRWTLHHSPLAVLSPRIQAEIQAGGAVRDMALARIAAGSVVMTAIADQVASGNVTGVGPKDPELRAALMRTGWQPYSIKAGDKWVSYSRSGTFGSLIGIAADASEMIAGTYYKQPNTINFDGEPMESSVAATVVMPFAQALLSKQYMSGLAEFVDALADPQRKGDSWARRLASSAVPAVVGAAERAIDPELRRAETSLQAIRARIPGLSEDLPPRLNMWGEPVKDENGIYNLFMPARVSAAKGTAIDQEIVRLQLEVQAPRQVQQFSAGGVSVNVKLNPEQHNRLIALAGNELKDPRTRQGARDTLDTIIQSDIYARASDDRRELMIRQVMTKFREAAKARLLAEDPDLLDVVKGGIQDRGRSITAPRQAPPGGAAPALQ